MVNVVGAGGASGAGVGVSPLEAVAATPAEDVPGAAPLVVAAPADVAAPALAAAVAG